MRPTQTSVHIRHGFRAALFKGISMFVIAALAVICVIPFLLILAGSFSSESAIAVNGYSLLPREFTLDAYKAIFNMGNSIPQAYMVTIFYHNYGNGRRAAYHIHERLCAVKAGF